MPEIAITDLLKSHLIQNKKLADEQEKPGHDIIPNEDGFDNLGFYHSVIDNSVQGVNGALKPRGQTLHSDDGKEKAAVQSSLAQQPNPNNERAAKRIASEIAEAAKDQPTKEKLKSVKSGTQTGFTDRTSSNQTNDPVNNQVASDSKITTATQEAAKPKPPANAPAWTGGK